MPIRTSPFELDRRRQTRSPSATIRTGFQPATCASPPIWKLRFPGAPSIEAHGRYGDFDITDIGGNVEIVSDNAGVRLQNIGGDVARRPAAQRRGSRGGVKGAFDLKGRGSDIDLQNMEGQVTITGAYSGVIQFRNLAKPLRFIGRADDH